MAESQERQAEGARGTNLYNTYHYLSKLVGLYYEAARLEHREHGSAFWSELAEGALADLGELFAVWDGVVRTALESPSGDQSETVTSMVDRACRRADIMIRLLTIWTPMRKWAMAMWLSERRLHIMMNQFLAALAPHHGEFVARLEVVLGHSLDRASRLTGRMEIYQRECRKLQPAAAHHRNANTFKESA